MFSVREVNVRSSDKLKCDNGRVTKRFMTNGSFGRAIRRTRTVTSNGGCDVTDYSDRTVLSKEIGVASCRTISLVGNLRHCSNCARRCCGAFAPTVRGHVGCCTLGNKGLLIDNSCGNDSVRSRRRGSFVNTVLGMGCRPANAGFAIRSVGPRSSAVARQSDVTAASPAMDKLNGRFDCCRSLGTGRCTTARPRVLGPVNDATFYTVHCLAKADTTITCEDADCHAFAVKFPLRYVDSRGAHCDVVRNVLGFLARWVWGRWGVCGVRTGRSNAHSVRIDSRRLRAVSGCRLLHGLMSDGNVVSRRILSGLEFGIHSLLRDDSVGSGRLLSLYLSIVCGRGVGTLNLRGLMLLCMS